MIYFDNAATTFPKPPQVIKTAKKALTQYGGNPGRAGHSLSLETAEAVFEAREKCGIFFGADTENTVFALNCTHALNAAIKGIMPTGGHCIISDVEHNASARPVHALYRERRISYSVAETFNDDDETIKSYEKLITPKTKAIISVMASNVTGKILPFNGIGALCKKHGICFILDAAQGGGVIPVSLKNGINIICCSGHKGLYGPMGTGILVTDGTYDIKPTIEGGTGTNSRSLDQPKLPPESLESGTINTPGVIALGEGIETINRIGMNNIYSHEEKLCDSFIDGVKKIKKIKLYDKRQMTRGKYVPLVPFNVEGMDSPKVSQILSNAGIFLRGGLHCSYFAHKKLGTLDTGVVRFAPGLYNDKSEVTALIRQLKRL